MPADAEKNNQEKRNEDFGAIDVAALMAQIRLVIPEGTVTVKGTVEALPTPKYASTMAWGVLRGFDEQSSISFKCPVVNAPKLKEHVILRGTLEVKPLTQHRGFDLQLLGDRIGEWTPSKPATTPLATSNRTNPKLSLESFLSKDKLKYLVFIGTETALNDVKNGLGQSPKQPFDTMVSTTGLDSLQAAIAKAAPKYDGLCLVRGGGPDSFATWNDPRLIEALINCGKPFYTAIGHTTDFTLADKYADESFATPTNLGVTCKEAWRVREKRVDLESQFEDLKRANEGARKAGYRDNLTTLQTAAEKLQKLPATLSSQISQDITTAIKASTQEGFSRPLTAAIEAAIKVQITNLNEATHHARDMMAQVARKSKFHTWTWLLSVFLLGVLTGGFGYHRIAQSKIDSIQNRLEVIQQQTAPTVSAPNAKPLDGKSPKSRREH